MKKLFSLKSVALTFVVSLCLFACSGGGKSYDKHPDEAFADGTLSVGSTKQEVMDVLGGYCASMEYNDVDSILGVSYPMESGDYYDIIFTKGNGGEFKVKCHGISKGDACKSGLFEKALGGTVGEDYEADEKAAKEQNAKEQAELEELYESVDESSYPKAADSFITPDLKFCDVRGHVKRIYYPEEMADAETTFKKDGTLDHFTYCESETELVRNKAGQITEIKYYDGSGPQYSKYYKYDSRGYISSYNGEDSGDGSYTINSDGFITGYKSIGYAEYTIRYTQFDSNGNWIESVTKNEKYGEYSKTTREITYY